MGSIPTASTISSLRSSRGDDRSSPFSYRSSDRLRQTVSELHADFGGKLMVRLRGGDTRQELVVSRDRVRPLKERLGLS